MKLADNIARSVFAKTRYQGMSHGRKTRAQKR